MSLLDDNPLGLLLGAANTLIDRLVPDNNAAQKAKDELASVAQAAAIKADQDQRDITKTQEAHPSLFVAGPRPAAMWVCVGGLVWQFFVAPIATWLIAAFHLVGLPPLPMIGDSTLTDLLYALLGLGSLRTADKLGGVDTRGVAPTNLIGSTFGVLTRVFPGKR